MKSVRSQWRREPRQAMPMHALVVPPPSQDTYDAFADPRLPHPYRPHDPELAAWGPAVPLVLKRSALLANLRSACQGAALGPFGFTSEILRIVLQ